MARFISKESIDEVIERADLVQVIGEYVRLEQRGNDYIACCPFHNDKSPSFSVTPEKKFYYCYGCHASGNVIKFLMETEKITFPEAIENLAKKFSIPLKYSGTGDENRKEDPTVKLKEEYIDLYTRVASSFHYLLMETQSGAFALDYIKKRGLTDETLKKFKLGYSPADKTWLHNFLTKKNYSREFLKNSGLFSRKVENYSFFVDRLMFPIFDRNGNVVAMGGRFLRGDSKKSPKYLNSPELIQYKKRSTLYAFNFAKKSINSNKKAIIAEGYMDVIAYHQADITWAVGTLGTALTEEHLSILKPLVNCIYLSFDSDGAGQTATKKAIYMCRKMDIEVRVITFSLEEAKDPAEILLKFGKEKLTNVVNNATLDDAYLINKLFEVYPKNTAEGKYNASKSFFEYVYTLQSEIQKESALDLLSQSYGISKEAVKKDYLSRNQNSNFYKKVYNSSNQNPSDQKKTENLISTTELKAVMTAINDDISYFKNIRNEISKEDLDDPNAKIIFSIMEELEASNNFSKNGVIARIESDQLRELVIRSVNEHSSTADQSAKDGAQTLEKLILNKKNIELQNQINRLNGSTIKEDMDLLQDLIRKKMEIVSQLNKLKG